MLLCVELIDYAASASHGVQYELYTKNSEDTGNGTQVIAASPSISTVSFSAPGGTPSQSRPDQDDLHRIGYNIGDGAR
jgi:hypothetical protein